MTLADFLKDTACERCTNACVYNYNDKIIPGCRLLKRILPERIAKCSYQNQNFDTASVCRNCRFCEKKLDQDVWTCEKIDEPRKVLQLGCEEFEYDSSKAMF